MVVEKTRSRREAGASGGALRAVSRFADFLQTDRKAISNPPPRASNHTRVVGRGEVAGIARPRTSLQQSLVEIMVHDVRVPGHTAFLLQLLVDIANLRDSLSLVKD